MWDIVAKVGLFITGAGVLAWNCLNLAVVQMGEQLAEVWTVTCGLGRKIWDMVHGLVGEAIGDYV